MNFKFMTDGEFPNEELKTYFEELEKDLERAESLYWKKPQQCGIMLRSIAEKICRFYNEHYEIGFGKDSSLEEFLCYRDDDEHNVLVSRFLSMVRKEQRDRLNKLRVIGDDCIWGEDGPDRGMEINHRMAQDAGKMMDTMIEIIKDMCHKLAGRNDLDQIFFYEDDVPDYSETEERFPGAGPAKEPEKKKSFLARLLLGE